MPRAKKTDGAKPPRDRGILSADAVAHIRAELSADKTPEHIAKMENYDLKYLQGRILALGLDKPAGAVVTAKATAKAKKPAKVAEHSGAVAQSHYATNGVLAGVPPSLRADLARLVLARLKSDYNIDVKPENADKATELYYEIADRLNTLKAL